MKNVGIECGVPPNQLRQGYGTPICIVLLSLVDKVIQKIGFSFKKPKLEEKKGNSKDDGLDIEDEMPDLINNEIDYGDDINGDDKKPTKDNKEGGEKQDDGTEIMFSGITQEDWTRELEKVSMKLKLEYGKINSNGSSEWRGHIQQIKQGGEKFNTAIPESRAVLENLSSEIDKSLEKIIKKEELLSKNHENIISDYKEKHKDRNIQINEYQQLNETVEELKREAEEVNDKIAQANEKYDKLSKKISDTSKLGNIKQAMQNLQNENISLDMKINILNHSILKYTIDPEIMKMINSFNDNNNVDDTSMYEEVV
jgi:predicted  nucleic acid-binding Zn-ribbon protein